MLKIRKHIDMKVLHRRQINNIINHVVREYAERTDLHNLEAIDIYVTLNPVRACKKILSGTTAERHGEIRDWICETKPNFSYWQEGKAPLILLNANEKIFKEKNWEAVRGLVAHELMHILNKMDGLEDTLEKQLKKASEKIYEILEKHKEIPPFTRDRLYVSLVRVTTTTSLIIKDILANTRAMSFGFDEHIFENYKVVFTDTNLLKFSEEDIINALKKDQKHVLDDVFLAYIGLNSTWITFKMFHNKWYKELQKLSDIDVPEIVKEHSRVIFDEMLRLRSTSMRTEILKILILTQEVYYELVKYFCHKLEVKKKSIKK